MPGRRMHPPERVAEWTSRGWWTDDRVDDVFRARVAERGSRPAVVDPPDKATYVDAPVRRLTWTELDADVDRLAATLLAAGLGEADVVALQLPNGVELTTAYLACWRIGAIVSPLPISFREHEIRGTAAIANFSAYLTATRIGERRVAAEVAALGLPMTLLAYGDDVPEGAVALDDALPTADVAAVATYQAAHPADPNDCLTVCFTSGTEAAPKAVPRAHYEWFAISTGTVEAPALTAEDVLLNPFPMVNMASISGMLIPWLLTGGVLVQHQPFSLPVFLQQVAVERVTYTVAPPALLAMLLQNEAILAQADLSSVRQIGSGSAPLQEWMVRGWADRHGITIINFFGSNEGIALMSDPVRMTDPGDRARYFPRYGGDREWSFTAAGFTDVKLVDPVSGEEVTEPGRPGELRIKGPTVFAGYLGDTPSPFDEEGYFRTGDVFAIAGEDGQYLEYVDRAKDLIIRGGTNIAPAEVESLVASHPAVAEVAVVGVPDDVLGERVCAVVVPRPDATVTLEEVVAHLQAQHVASYKLPERLELVEALPRNPVGKILKRHVRDALPT